MPETEHKYGVRIYPLDSEIILIKQTVKKPGAQTYVIDTLSDGTHWEAHVNMSDSAGIADAVRKAVEGKLGSK